MSLTHRELLDYYSTPGAFTELGGFERAIDAVSASPEAMAAFVQSLIIHEGWRPAYGVAVTAERTAEKELHGASAMLRCAARLDAAPLHLPRKPEHRVVGVCRHFATMFVACARHNGVPARARCGFADYFDPGEHGEHWVAEYWNVEQQRWILVDAQIDDLQRAALRLDFDTFDVPRDRFLVAGDAWRACRNGADPLTFGVGGDAQLWGLVEVYGELFQDLANLQKIELLPWGWYGLAKDKTAIESETDLIDRLAELTSRADAAAISELRELVDSDARLQVPRESLAAIIAEDRKRSALARE